MRIRKRSIVLLVAMIGLSWRYYKPVISKFDDAVSTLKQQRFQDETSRITSFSVQSDTWTTFQIPTQAVAIRALTNAALFEIPPYDVFANIHRPGWRYSIDYQLLDESDELIRESTYHFRSNISRFRNNETGEVFSPSFFRNSKHVPIQTRTMTIALNSETDRPVRRIRLKLSQHDPEIAGVVARIATRVPNQNADSLQSWTRLSVDRRQQISRSNVYTHDLLTDAERLNLIRWSWQQSVPVGIANQDFVPRIMYSIDNIIGEELGNDVQPVGLVSQPGRPATIPVPVGQGVVRLKLTPTDRPDAATSSPKTRIAWFGVGSENRSIQNVTIDELATIDVPVDGGLIEIASPLPVEILALWIPNHELPVEDLKLAASGERVFDITPDPIVVGTYIVNRETLAKYSVYHPLGSSSTSFKLTVRGYETPSDPATFQAPASAGDPIPPSIDVIWKTRSKDGSELRKGVITVDTTRAQYDYILHGNDMLGVSDAADSFFNIESAAATIEFSSTTPCLLAGFTRPDSVVRTNVPDDYHPFQRRNSLNRKWFFKRAINHDQFERDLGILSVRIQARPPEDDEQILAGDYEWEDFRPNDDWRGRFLLLPQSDSLPMRNEAIASSYWELKANQQLSVTAISDGQNAVRPKLIYSVDDKIQLDVELDGKNVLSRQTRSTSGEFHLPAMNIDDTQNKLLVRADDDDTRILVNGLQPVDSPRFLKRLAQIPSDGRLQFTVDKRTVDKEVLMLRTYTSDPNSETTVVRVSIETSMTPTLPESPEKNSQQPGPDWTFRHREYTVANNLRQEILSPGFAKRFFAGQHACFITLGQDLPPGPYRIKIESADNTVFVLYRTTAGRSDALRVYQQTVSPADLTRDERS